MSEFASNSSFQFATRAPSLGNIPVGPIVQLNFVEADTARAQRNFCEVRSDLPIENGPADAQIRWSVPVPDEARRHGCLPFAAESRSADMRSIAVTTTLNVYGW